MKKWFVIGFALGLVSCASSQFPLDDAYYRPAAQTTQITQTTQTTKTTQTTQTTKTTQTTIEYLSVQDTTVTIRIKK